MGIIANGKLMTALIFCEIVGNLVESYNVFELVASKEKEVKERMARKWNTAMAKEMAFGPSITDVPGFLLTAKWTRIKVKLQDGLFSAAKPVSDCSRLYPMIPIRPC